MIKISSVVILLVVLGCSCSASSPRSETQHQNVVTFKSERSDPKSDAWCEMCELVMDRVKVLIKEEDSQGKVNSTLYGLCNVVRGEMRKQCYQMVPLVKYQLTHGFDSRQVCLMLQFCGGGQAASYVIDFLTKMNGNGAAGMWKELRPIFEGLQPHIQGWFQQFGFSKAHAHAGISISCMMCKTAVGLIDSTLDQYKKPLTDYVVGICNDLPSPTSKACSDAMGFYIPAWWDAFFTNIASPGEICFDFGMCTESIVSSPPRVIKQ